MNLNSVSYLQKSQIFFIFYLLFTVNVEDDKKLALNFH